MKIQSAFQPVQITLESIDEVRSMLDLCNRHKLFFAPENGPWIDVTGAMTLVLIQSLSQQLFNCGQQP